MGLTLADEQIIHRRTKICTSTHVPHQLVSKMINFGAYLEKEESHFLASWVLFIDINPSMAQNIAPGLFSATR